jgi:hypothetical protein
MIPELIFSAVALVFYFGIEGYYYYKDKGKEEDFLTETTYTEPPKEVINVGDTVLIYRTTPTLKITRPYAEGVVLAKAQNGAIKVGTSWYDENISDHGHTFSFSKLKEAEKVRVKEFGENSISSQGSVIYNSKMELILETPFPADRIERSR